MTLLWISKQFNMSLHLLKLIYRKYLSFESKFVLFTLLDKLSFFNKRLSISEQNLHENSQSIALLYNHIHEGNNLKNGETNVTACKWTAKGVFLWDTYMYFQQYHLVIFVCYNSLFCWFVFQESHLRCSFVDIMQSYLIAF